MSHNNNWMRLFPLKSFDYFRREFARIARGGKRSFELWRRQMRKIGKQ